MEKIEKGVQVLMWIVVILTVLIFFATIMLGHATDYGFLFGFENVSELNKTIEMNSNAILS